MAKYDSESLFLNPELQTEKTPQNSEARFYAAEEILGGVAVLAGYS